MEAAYVIGLGLYAGLMAALSRLLVRRLAARKIPELALAHSAITRNDTFGCIYDAVDDENRFPLLSRVPILILTGVMACLGVWGKVSLPVVFLIAFLMLTMMPVLDVIRFWLIRDRLRIRVRQKLAEIGVAVCQTCGASLPDDTSSQCPACGNWPDEEVIPAKPVTVPVPETTDSTGSHPKWSWIAPLLVLLILLISVPFEMSFLKSTGKTLRESYQRMEVPGELMLTVARADRYGFFVPQAAVSEATALLIRVVDTNTGQELAVRKTSSDKTHVTADRNEVKVVRVVEIPAAGEYRVITAGLESGAVYVKPAMRGWAITRVLIVAAPLAGALLLIFVADRVARRRTAAEIEAGQ